MIIRSEVPPRLLIEARPGAGKTTAFRRLAGLLRDSGAAVAGFTTEEIRQSGKRVGFSVESIGGEAATLAHVDLPGPPRVSRYGVDLEAFERVALPSLEAPPGAVVLIDELGKMELASERFRAAVEDLFESELPLAATVQVARHPFTVALRARAGVEVVRLTAANRDDLPRQLAERLTSDG
ncbi:MAG TPA: nucleoside-triphosphatase [Thermoleophilaceae bacterium]|nr:nucleoside-triphosphatase [Thermoleophilaceae bacterium]